MSGATIQGALFPELVRKRVRRALEAKPQKREMRLTAREARDEGMDRAKAKVEQDMPRWYELAVEAVRQYALKHREFMCESARARAEADGLAIPRDKRAWGHVMPMAAKRGYVEKIGQAQACDPKVHMNYAGLWRSRICRAPR